MGCQSRRHCLTGRTNTSLEFQKWKNDPATFLSNNEQQVPFSLREYYNYALSVHTLPLSSKILRRFVMTTLYDVLSEPSPSQKLQKSDPAVIHFMDIVSQSACHQASLVHENIFAWAPEGSRSQRVGFQRVRITRSYRTPTIP